MIAITEEQIQRVNLLLDNIKNAPNRALFQVINRALTTVRSQSGKAVRQTYHVKQADITAHQSMKQKRATASELVGTVEFAGTVLPLKRFQVTPSAPARRTVNVAVLKAAGSKRLESAYVADLGRYGVGVFERQTRRRASSQQLYGPSTAQMIGREQVLEQVEEKVQTTIDKRVEQEISRILNGYGGGR